MRRHTVEVRDYHMDQEVATIRTLSHLPWGAPMPSVDRERFIRDGFLILRGVVPPDELESLRVSYEVVLEKQKAGKKKMRQFGKVDIPQEAFISALKMDS